jgi:hypothetical protein
MVHLAKPTPSSSMSHYAQACAARCPAKFPAQLNAKTCAVSKKAGAKRTSRATKARTPGKKTEKVLSAIKRSSAKRKCPAGALRQEIRIIAWGSASALGMCPCLLVFYIRVSAKKLAIQMIARIASPTCIALVDPCSCQFCALTSGPKLACRHKHPHRTPELSQMPGKLPAETE